MKYALQIVKPLPSPMEIDLSFVGIKGSFFYEANGGMHEWVKMTKWDERKRNGDEKGFRGYCDLKGNVYSKWQFGKSMGEILGESSHFSL